MATPKDLGRVAVDIMGGDNAPEEIVRGALLAAAEGNGRLHIILAVSYTHLTLPTSDLV